MSTVAAALALLWNIGDLVVLAPGLPGEFRSPHSSRNQLFCSYFSSGSSAPYLAGTSLRIFMAYRLHDSRYQHWFTLVGPFQ